ncbi:hypothetical protein O9X81_00040 [Agrobacterium salinitolerans]|uniref:hypothetical protein n=1 Tax=Agrobacterium salinitolerans TaxID=1183413 RepID=UPI0022B85005|nr:hypothetical protein [Agrobacterium salinitolerans]MCZ7854997.1 hypothetical protein [Agrobacterium salinitolerans]
MNAKFTVTVSKSLEVEFDSSKLTPEFWEKFNSLITDRGGPDPEYLAEHAGWNFVQGDEKFIEGIGDLKEMNIKISEIDIDIDVMPASFTPTK